MQADSAAAASRGYLLYRKCIVSVATYLLSFVCLYIIYTYVPAL